VIACVALLCAVFWTTVISSQDLDFKMGETEIGWQIGNDMIEVFSGSAIAAPPPGTIVTIKRDFESFTLRCEKRFDVLKTASNTVHWQPKTLLI